VGAVTFTGHGACNGCCRQLGSCSCGSCRGALPSPLKVVVWGLKQAVSMIKVYCQIL
jgi:hypothetical protein